VTVYTHRAIERLEARIATLEQALREIIEYRGDPRAHAWDHEMRAIARVALARQPSQEPA
jgi:uncharacterized protein (DUF924 family)